MRHLRVEIGSPQRRGMMKKHHTKSEKEVILSRVDKIRKNQGISIKKAFQEIGIGEASYYKWKKEGTISPEKKEDSDPGVDEETPKVVVATKIDISDQKKILEIKASFPHMGVKQLRQHLIRNHKIRYSERQIRQFLQKEEVPSIKSSFAPQPLRRFERELSNEMWQIDIMNFHVGCKSLYLTSFLDDHSRFIVSYTVSEDCSTQVILELLRRAVSFRKPLSILSDRGIQFCSWNGVTAFQMELKSLKIDHLLAREQHPETMGKIEAFHKTIKRELLTTVEFSDISEAKIAIHDYIMFYNFARPHMGIENQAPAERYFKRLRAFNHQSVYHRRINPFPEPVDDQKEMQIEQQGSSFKEETSRNGSRKSQLEKRNSQLETEKSSSESSS